MPLRVRVRFRVRVLGFGVCFTVDSSHERGHTIYLWSLEN